MFAIEPGDFARRLDAFFGGSLSGGGTVLDAKVPVAPGYQVPFAAAIKQATGLTTIAVGLITEAEQAALKRCRDYKPAPKAAAVTKAAQLNSLTAEDHLKMLCLLTLADVDGYIVRFEPHDLPAGAEAVSSGLTLEHWCRSSPGTRGGWPVVVPSASFRTSENAGEESYAFTCAIRLV